MEVTGLDSARPAGVRRPASSARPEETARPAANRDGVEAFAVDRRPDGPRAERLAEIRTQIENGTYETTERLEAALARFLGEVDENS